MNPAPDCDDDTRDGILFRFWIRMASYPGGSPLRLALAFSDVMKGEKGDMTPAHYRKALTDLAIKEGVNLP